MKCQILVYTRLGVYQNGGPNFDEPQNPQTKFYEGWGGWANTTLFHEGSSKWGGGLGESGAKAPSCNAQSAVDMCFALIYIYIHTHIHTHAYVHTNKPTPRMLGEEHSNENKSY